MPQRLQLSRRKGYRKPSGAIIVDRRSKWANKHPVGRMCPLCRTVHDRKEAVEYFRGFLLTAQALFPADFERWIAPLIGHDLLCWCPLPGHGEPDLCHAAVLLAFANMQGPQA